MIRVICDLTLLQYRQKPFMLTYLEIYKVKSFIVKEIWGIRLSISCSLQHYQFSINAIGDFNAQDYGLLEQKQTT